MTKLRCWLRTVLLIAIGLFWVPGAMADLSDGLVAYYPFDGNAQDASGNGNDGTVNGATLTKDRFGNAESAYRFDGNDQIIVNSFRNFHWGENFSISMWFQRTGQWGNYQGIVNSGYYTYGSWEIRMGRENNGTKLGGGVVTSPSPKTWDYDNLYVSQNGLYHVVMTYDGSSLSFYLDGVAQLGGGNDSGEIITKDTPLTIGQAGTGMNREYFFGTIDDIRIYNRALSESEIKQLYQMDNQPSDDCWATYENGNLHIPCIKVKGPFDEDLHYEADMQYEPLSDPMSFQVTGVKPK